MRGHVVSQVSLIKVEIFDSCLKNIPTLVKPEKTELQFDLRANMPEKL